MAKQTLYARLNVNFVAVLDRLLWGGINLRSGKKYPNDYRPENQQGYDEPPKTFHNTLKDEPIPGLRQEKYLHSWN